MPGFMMNAEKNVNELDIGCELADRGTQEEVKSS